MTELTLYHGSTVTVGKPVFGLGKESNDYGRGFYCTESPELAKGWACQYNKPGFSNSYRLETDGLDILNLESEEYSAMNWIAVVLRNRQIEPQGERGRYRVSRIVKMFYVDTDSHDVVTGYRADDSYFMFATQFVNGFISYERLKTALRLGDFGIQVVLKSRDAFDRIEFLGAEPVSPGRYYNMFRTREETATRLFLSFSKNDDSEPTGTFVDDILDGRVTV